MSVSLKRYTCLMALIHMSEPNCDQQSQLSRVMYQAMDAAYRAKEFHEDAVRHRGSYINTADMLADARAVARNAIRAFKEHRKAHGC